MIANLQALRRLFPRSGHWVALGALLAALQAAFLVPVALLIEHAFDDVIPDRETGALVVLGALLLALFLASSLVAVATRRLILHLTTDAIADLRIALLDRIQALPLRWFDHNDVARVHSILVADSERVYFMATSIASQGAPALIVCGALSIALVIVAPLLFAILAITVPAIYLSGRRMRPVLVRRTYSWMESYDRFSARMLFALRARPLIAAHGTEEVERRRAAAEIRKLSDDGLAMGWMQALYAQIFGTISAVAVVIVLVIGGAAVADGRTSLGALVSFFTLVGLMRGQSGPLMTAGAQLISGAESLRRLEDVLHLQEPPAYPAGGRRIDWSGSCELHSVAFAYGEHEVLRDVSILVPAGEWTALAGPNGAGKTTIAALALGLYRPDGGVVSADGIPLPELDVTDLRSQAAVVSQDPFLFAGSVADNIGYGSDDAAPESIAEAARLAGAAALIEALPDGYATEVGDEGTLLSGGQRQVVMIVRAIHRRPRLLVLDEPTSSLDDEVAPRVLAALRELPWRPTVLLISHDPAVLALVDRRYDVGGRGARLATPDPPLAGAPVDP